MTGLSRLAPRLTSLRARLVAFALLCAVPVLTLMALQLHTEGRRIEQQAQAMAELAAERLERRLVGILGAAESVGHAIGALDLSQPGVSRACNAALARAVQASGPHMLNYSVVDTGGDIVCSAQPLRGPVNVADRPYLQQALATGRPVLSGYTFGRVTRLEALQLAVPRQDAGGKVDSVAIIALAAGTLAEGITAGEVLPHVLLVLDTQGVLVSRYPAVAGMTGRSYADAPLVRHQRRQDAPRAVLPGLDGVQRLYAFRTIVYRGETVLRVAAGVDMQPLQQQERAARQRDLAIVLAVIFAVVAVAVALTAPVVLARVQALAAAAREVASGRYQARVPMRTVDDLTPVESAFNQMLDAIEHERRGLAESESRFRLLFEHSLDGVIQLGPDGAILAANPAASQLLRCAAGELAGRHWQDLMDPADPRVRALATPDAGGDVTRAELRLLRGDGSTVEAEVARSAYRDSEGHGLACVVFRDIGERLRGQHALSHLNRDLENRVKRRTQELEGAMRELEAFSYSVSHDLRTPVSVVSSFAGVLLERDAVSGEKNRHYLSRILAAARHMNELIEGLLTLSRISRDRLNWTVVDLGVLAHEALQQCRDAEPGRSVRVAVAEGMQVLGDAQLLRIALSNLVNNAWKFTRRQAQPRITIEAVAGAGGTGPVFCIRDNGTGFDASQADRLFHAFQRLHTEAEFPGIGIGLATVERVVRRHGGRIWAESRPGEGAAFFFVLGPGEPQPLREGLAATADA